MRGSRWRRIVRGVRIHSRTPAEKQHERDAGGDYEPLFATVTRIHARLIPDRSDIGKPWLLRVRGRKGG